MAHDFFIVWSTFFVNRESRIIYIGVVFVFIWKSLIYTRFITRTFLVY